MYTYTYTHRQESLQTIVDFYFNVDSLLQPPDCRAPDRIAANLALDPECLWVGLNQGRIFEA